MHRCPESESIHGELQTVFGLDSNRFFVLPGNYPVFVHTQYDLTHAAVSHSVGQANCKTSLCVLSVPMFREAVFGAAYTPQRLGQERKS